jgi:hypothetical protein
LGRGIDLDGIEKSGNADKITRLSMPKTIPIIEK